MFMNYDHYSSFICTILILTITRCRPHTLNNILAAISLLLSYQERLEAMQIFHKAEKLRFFGIETILPLN